MYTIYALILWKMVSCFGVPNTLKTQFVREHHFLSSFAHMEFSLSSLIKTHPIVTSATTNHNTLVHDTCEWLEWANSNALCKPLG